MSVRSVFTSHSGLVGERGSDMSSRVLMTGYGGTAPLLALSSGMPTKPAPQVSFTFMEDQHISGNQAIVTGGDSTATSIVVDDAGIWVPNTVLMNQATGEHMLITAIASDNATLTVIRGLSGTTAQTITTDDRIQSIGTAHEEGGDRPEPVAQRGEERTNYVQIFKNAWAITGTAKSVDFITGSQIARNKQQCFGYHAEDIERAFWFGRKEIRVLNGKQTRLSDGVVAQIEAYGGQVESANSGSTAGALSLWDLREWMRKIFDVQVKGERNERIAFTGSRTLGLIQQMVHRDSQYNIEKRETEHGLKVTKILGFNGDLTLMTHPMFTENDVWQGEITVLHPALIAKRIKRKTWQGEYTEGRMNNNGKDADEGYIGIEMGFELRGAPSMGIYRNIQSSAASL